MTELTTSVWRRLTYLSRLRRNYKRWSGYGLPAGLALRRAREDLT